MKAKQNSQDLSQISKIRKLANKRGTPLLEVQFNKKSIRFYYKSSVGSGVLGFFYTSRDKGILGELRRLNK